MVLRSLNAPWGVTQRVVPIGETGLGVPLFCSSAQAITADGYLQMLTKRQH